MFRPFSQDSTIYEYSTRLEKFATRQDFGRLAAVSLKSEVVQPSNEFLGMAIVIGTREGWDNYKI